MDYVGRWSCQSTPRQSYTSLCTFSYLHSKNRSSFYLELTILGPLRSSVFTRRIFWCEPEIRTEWPKSTKYGHMSSVTKYLSAYFFIWIPSPPTEYYQKCHKWKPFYFIFGPRQTCWLTPVSILKLLSYSSSH